MATQEIVSTGNVIGTLASIAFMLAAWTFRRLVGSLDTLVRDVQELHERIAVVEGHVGISRKRR